VANPGPTRGVGSWKDGNARTGSASLRGHPKPANGIGRRREGYGRHERIRTDLFKVDAVQVALVRGIQSERRIPAKTPDTVAFSAPHLSLADLTCSKKEPAPITVNKYLLRHLQNSLERRKSRTSGKILRRGSGIFPCCNGVWLLQDG
jgi:hypothetical protein